MSRENVDAVRAIHSTAALVAVGSILLIAAAHAQARQSVYVALGDSYTSAPLVPTQHGEPIDCGRSDHNYPSLVADATRPDQFRDVSCGSATTDDLTQPQSAFFGGINPPQFLALSRDTTLVTMGMGGNDASIAGTAEECVTGYNLSPTGSPCKDAHIVDGQNTIQQKIRDTGPKIARAIRGIHRRSPRARVLVVGYPAAVPNSGPGCWPLVPVASGDVAWLRHLLLSINRVLRQVAGRGGAEYVDTYTPTIGHDACQLPGTKWFEGVVPTAPAFPLHPNAAGEAAMARAVLAQLRKPALASDRQPRHTHGM
jgi:lysophospholipase L1-like esterase